MPTRTEAAQALYEAAKGIAIEKSGDGERWSPSPAEFTLLLAIDGFKTATPNALPAEVARVVEAADAFDRAWDDGTELSQCGGEARDLCAAVRAYRSTQPEPLSARLARLRPGSVVEEFSFGTSGKYTVIGNYPPDAVLWGRAENGNRSIIDYSNVRAILSEAP